MRISHIALIVITILLGIAWPVNAAPGPGGVSECETYVHQTTVNLPLGIAAGDVEAKASLPGCNDIRSSTQVLQWVMNYNGPVFLGASAFAFASAATGCTIPAIMAGPALNAAASNAVAATTITMTSNECHGFIQLTLTVGPAYVWYAAFAFNLVVRQPAQVSLCAASGLSENTYTPAQVCTTPQIDNQNRLCAASAPGADCNTPTINAAITGTLTATLGGTLDVLDRLCNASATGAACTAPTINAVLSGTLDNLNRLCAASALGSSCTAPTISATLAGNINANLAGTLDVLARLCAASATGTSCTPATVNAILSGALTVHQDQACGASLPTRCYAELSGVAINQTVNGNQTFPSQFTLCGPGSDDTTCTPIQAAAAGTFPTIELGLQVLFWLLALAFFLWQDWPFPAAFTIPGLLHSMFPADVPGTFFGYVLFCVLGIVLQYFAGDRMKFTLYTKKPKRVETP